MYKQVLLVPALLSIASVGFAENTSPWLPIPGQLSLTLNVTDQTGDNAYIGDDEIKADTITGGAANSFDRTDTSVLLQYGVSDNLAVDALLGYGESEAGTADEDAGFTDAILGVSWRVVDEFLTVNKLPTVTLRGAVIFAGDYDGNRLAGLGKGENGFQASVVVGKQFTEKFSASAELGYEERGGDVPEATYYSLIGHYQPRSDIGLSLGYSSKEYDSDLDIGGPGFNPSRFQEVNEEREVATFNIGWAVAAKHGVALSYATLLDGRNTVADDDIVALTYTFTP